MTYAEIIFESLNLIVLSVTAIFVILYWKETQSMKLQMVEQNRISDLTVKATNALVAAQRAWVFAGCGTTTRVSAGQVHVHPDHRNNGASPAFVEYVFVDFWPRSKKLPENPVY